MVWSRTSFPVQLLLMSCICPACSKNGVHQLKAFQASGAQQRSHMIFGEIVSDLWTGVEDASLEFLLRKAGVVYTSVPAFVSF